MELVQADIEGRVVVLPCKPGATVYILCPINLSIEMGSMVSGKTVKENCDRCAYCGCECCGEISTGLTAITKIANASALAVFKKRDFFGKTIFLSHEEAEAALAARGE